MINDWHHPPFFLATMDFHPAALTPESVTPFATIPFFDLDKREWRSFNIENFIGFVTIWELKEKRTKRENKEKTMRVV